MRWEYRLRMIDPELGTGAEARAELCMRSARDGDEVPLLGMFDEAVVWCCRGQEARWDRTRGLGTRRVAMPCAR